MPISHVVAEVAGTVTIAGSWSAVGGTAQVCLATNGDGKYLTATSPFIAPGNIKGVNHGFALPADAYDLAIEFNISAKKTGTNTMALSPMLTKDGTTVSNTWPDIELTTSYALYGAGFFYGYTYAEVNAATFGFMLKPKAGGTGTPSIQVDHVIMYITYWTPGVIDPPPPPPGNVRDLSNPFMRIPPLR
jgi:hypothetical protein